MPCRGSGSRARRGTGGRGRRRRTATVGRSARNPDQTGRLFVMATFRDLLAAAKAEIREVDPAGAAAMIADGATVLDVREPDEYDAGALERAVHIPRGHLESQVEN